MGVGWFVTSTAGDPRAPPVFRLQTFGTLRLVGSADDTVLGDHGHQRRRLALLAVLAAANEQGRSRDQLLSLFWPETDQSRARHSLEQLLYAIRTSLGENVFTGTSPLRLDDTVLASDVGAFGGALAAGELAAAVELYRGRFLDGFYLNDAPEFEQWLEAERGRLERRYAEALENLAKQAERVNDLAAVGRWRQKLIEVDPLSSTHAIGLIRALEKSGDHIGALKYAERYEGIVRRELGASVGPAVSELVAEVRERAKTESVVVRSAARPEPHLAQRNASVAAHIAADQDGSNGNGIGTHGEPTDHRSVSPRSRASIYRVAMLTLAVVVIGASWIGSREPGRAAIVTPSIAVLPLVNVGGDPHDAALVDGLTEDLIGVIAKIDRLRVVGPTSAFVFRNSNLDVRRIADSLGVANILEGSVQKDGGRLRVQMRLVDASDRSTRWAETYDRELKDIFLVQSEIAAAVARELDVRLGGPALAALRRQPTQNVAAYELYGRASDPVLLRSDSGLRSAIAYFKQAIAVDSTYADAYAGLGRMYVRLLLSQTTAIPPRALYVMARDAALKSVSLNDSLPEAHLAVGTTLMVGYDLAAAERELKRAVAIAPTDFRTPMQLSRLYTWEERPADALAAANRAVEDEPLSPNAQIEAALQLCANHEYVRGLARMKQLEALRPPLLRLPSYSGICHAMNGDWAGALAAVRQHRSTRSRGIVGFVLARAGERQEAQSLLAELTNYSMRTNQGAFEVAVVHAGLGDRDEAFEWLDRSKADLSLSENIMLPLFDDLHADPRFDRLRRWLRR